MVENPRQAYGALLVTITAAISAIIIFSGFIAPEFVIRGNTFWVYLGAVVMMIVCAIISWATNLPRILSREFGTNGGDH